VLDSQTDGRLVRLERRQGELWIAMLMLVDIGGETSSTLKLSCTRRAVWACRVDGRMPIGIDPTVRRSTPSARSGDPRPDQGCVIGRFTPAATHGRSHPSMASGGLRKIGQDVMEVLDYEPRTLHVIRHVRPKMACAGCQMITRAIAPTRPMARCMAGASLLTHVAVGKSADHVPLYRLSQIYDRDGVEMSRCGDSARM